MTEKDEGRVAWGSLGPRTLLSKFLTRLLSKVALPVRPEVIE